MLVSAVLLSILSVVYSAKVKANQGVWTLKLLDLAKYPNALCLDGTPGGYWFQTGYGDGANKFIIHHQGGGWCEDEADCYSRSLTDLGSSSTWAPIADCSAGSSAQPCTYDNNEGIFGLDATLNPITYNWNQLYLPYCDGASLSGHLPDVVTVPSDPTHTVHFKGRYILDAAYETFLSEHGMNTAKEVIISGTSAGGLSVYLHTDYLANKIRQSQLDPVSNIPRVIAVPDAGFFMDLPAYSNGQKVYTPIYQKVFAMQGVSDSINDACVAHYTASNEAWKCFVAQYTLPFIQTPLFIVNSMIDSWQADNIMQLGCNPTIVDDCNEDQIGYVNTWRLEMVKHSSLGTFLTGPNTDRKHAAWLCECYMHPLVNYNYYWFNVLVGKQTMRDTFANWYYQVDPQDAPYMVVDGEWGSNPTCGAGLKGNKYGAMMSYLYQAIVTVMKNLYGWMKKTIPSK